MVKDAKAVEKSVETVWKSLWGNCAKVSTYFSHLKVLYRFLCKSRVFHRVVQKFYSIISPCFFDYFTGVVVEFCTFST